MIKLSTLFFKNMDAIGIELDVRTGFECRLEAVHVWTWYIIPGPM
jgi:hypothetical protein